MRRRGCLIGCGGFSGLIVICLLLGIFVGIPQVRDAAMDGISDAVSTEIADQAVPGQIDGGTYRFPLSSLQAGMNDNQDVDNAQDFSIRSDGSQVKIGFKSGDQEFSYTATPAAEDGQFALNDVKVSNGFLGWFLPPDRFADAIESGVNNYFEANDLVITSVSVDGDDLVIEAE